jgi:hypothetical protein
MQKLIRTAVAVVATSAFCALPAVLGTASSNADPTSRADPVLCQDPRTGDPSNPGVDPYTGRMIAGHGTAVGGAAGGEGTVAADVQVTCYGNQDVFLRYRITRVRDGRTFDGSAWMRLAGADCVRPDGCTRNLRTPAIKINGNLTGNDEWTIDFLNFAGNTSSVGGANVYPTTVFPRVLPPTSPPLEVPVLLRPTSIIF